MAFRDVDVGLFHKNCALNHYHAWHGRDAPLFDKLNGLWPSCFRRDGLRPVCVCNVHILESSKMAVLSNVNKPWRMNYGAESSSERRS